MTQKRIRSLDTYTQLASGDPGYIAPSAVFLAVDSASFAEESKKQAIEDYLSTTHVEKARETGLASRSIAVTFGAAFTGVPVTVALRVYRITAVVSGKYRFQDVSWYHATATPVTATGFELEIETSESLTGIILEYHFI